MEDILDYARELLQNTLQNESGIRKFKSFFGISPNTLHKLIHAIQTDDPNRNFETKHIYWTLFWLKNCCVEAVCVIKISTEIARE